MNRRRIVATLIEAATELDAAGYGEMANIVDAVSERLAQMSDDAPQGSAQNEVLMPDTVEEDASRNRHKDVDMFLKHLQESGAEVVG